MSAGGKEEVVARVRGLLEERCRRMAEAARGAARYATDADSRAESKYDTRSLEASYLAAGQAGKAEELAAGLRAFDAQAFPEFAENDRIGPGALVEAELEGEVVFFLVAPGGGGLRTEYAGCELTVVSPDSPLGEKLCGRRAGDELEGPAVMIYAVS